VTDPLSDADIRALAADPDHVLREPNPKPHPDDDISLALVPFVPSGPGSDEGDAADAADASPYQQRRRSLVEIADAEAELFHDSAGIPYARVVVGHHREVWPVGSKHFKEWLVGLFFEEYEYVPKTAALNEALLAISGKARFRGEQHDVYLRLAANANGILIDLANSDWEAIEVTPEGWNIVADPPVVFRRTRSMSPLPVPVRGGSVTQLRRFLNVAEEDGWRLLLAWLLFAFSPAGPYPVLILHGEQGSAKSTAARLLRSLVDPSAGSGLRAAPKDQEDLAVATYNGWLIALDNISSLRPWLSDALCRIATGGGLSKRELYSDAEEISIW
jgi:hypothetical protein